MKLPSVVAPPLTRLAPAILIVAVWLWFCGSMLIGTTVPAYRDSGYLYYPMLEAHDAVWASGRIPLWNPWDNAGFPEVADGSSSVFYPGKLVFAIRVLPFPQRYGMFLAMHLLLAAAGAYQLARDGQLGPAGATVAAIAFAFGGPVVFQVTNAIYLVSAAWLPWTLRSLFRWQRTGNRSDLLAASAGSALMLLGGDPQMVYHIGLIAAVLTVVAWVQPPVRRGDETAPPPSRLSRLTGLTLLVGMTACLSAVQWYPTWELARRSERMAAGDVVNLASWVTTAVNDPQSESLQRPSWLYRDDQTLGQVQFSQPPWSVIEWWLPNVSGRPFPTHDRWADEVAAADRMWFPSLYAGWLVAALAVWQMRFWGSDRQAVGWTWLTIWFALGSLGWYGGVWFANELLTWFSTSGESSQLAPPVGGVYWWMSSLLPRYTLFRYPAKLMVIAALGMALLGGRGVDRLGVPDRRSPWLIVLASLAFATAGVMVVEFWIRGAVTGLATEASLLSRPASLYGPFDPAAATRQIHLAILHVAAVGIGLGVLMAGLRSLRHDLRRWSWPAGLAILIAADLAVANRWLTTEIPSDAFSSPVTTTAVTGSDQPTIEIGSVAAPESFAQRRSENRLSELITWQRQSLQPKHHVPAEVRKIGSFHSIWPSRYRAWIDARLAGAPAILENTREQNPAWSYRYWSLDWNQADFDLELSAAGWIELPIFGDSHWSVTRHGEPQDAPQAVPTRVSEHDLLEIELPAGRQRVELRYRPRWLPIAGTVTVVAWMFLLTAGTLRWRRQRGHFGTKPTGGTSSPGATGG